MTQKYLLWLSPLLMAPAMANDEPFIHPPIIAATQQPSDVSYDIVEIAPTKKFLNIRVVGYGAAPQSKELSLTQKKLMAYRASQLDAYRLMAEHLNGLRLSASSVNKNSQIEEDTVRTSLDGTLKGVRLMNTEWTAEGVARTIAEISIPQ